MRSSRTPWRVAAMAAGFERFYPVLFNEFYEGMDDFWCKLYASFNVLFVLEANLKSATVIPCCFWWHISSESMGQMRSVPVGWGGRYVTTVGDTPYMVAGSPTNGEKTVFFFKGPTGVSIRHIFVSTKVLIWGSCIRCVHTKCLNFEDVFHNEVFRHWWHIFRLTCAATSDAELFRPNFVKLLRKLDINSKNPVQISKKKQPGTNPHSQNCGICSFWFRYDMQAHAWSSSIFRSKPRWTYHLGLEPEGNLERLLQMVERKDPQFQLVEFFPQTVCRTEGFLR